MSISAETLRIADLAVRDWLRSVIIDYGDNFLGTGRNLRSHPLFVIRSAPERAFATMRDHLIKEQFIPPDPDRTEVPDDVRYKQTPFPLCRFDMTDFRLDTTRSGSPAKIPMNLPGNRVREYKFPTPYALSYTVEWRARTFFTMNHLNSWLMGQFTQQGSGVSQRKLVLNYRDPWGPEHATLELEAVSDSSEFEAEEFTDRLITRTATFTLYAWDPDLTGLEPDLSDGGQSDGNGLTGAPMAFFPSVDVINPSTSDDAGFFLGGVIGSATSTGRLFDVSPVPVYLTQPYTTGSRLRAGNTPGPIDIAGSTFIETMVIPGPASGLMTGLLKARWYDVADPEAPVGPLVFSVVNRDARTPTVSNVLQISQIAAVDNAASFSWTTRPEASNNFPTAVRISVPNGDNRTYRVVLDRMAMGLQSLPVGVSVGPGIGPTFTATFAVNGGKRHLFRADIVNPDGVSLTIDIYDNDLSITPVATITTTATSGEILREFSAGTATVGKFTVTNGTSNANVSLTRVTVSPLAQPPYKA